MQNLNKILDVIDEINAQDPNKEIVDGKSVAKELIYGQRMTEMLHEFMDTPSIALQIAARGQHIKRWVSKRDSYPMDRVGYLKWRTALKNMHADLLEELLSAEDYEETVIQKVKDLVTKKRLKTDEEVQALEDVICLVFLKYYFNSFFEKHEEEKILNIIRKTWGKMSEKGHEVALKLDFPEKSFKMIEKALEL